MQVVEAKTYGGPEVLEPATRPTPTLELDQVLVRVRAAAINPVDWLTRSGALAAMLPDLVPPFVPGWDLAGVVEESRHPAWSPGQRVLAMVPWFDVGSGTYAELVVADPEWLAELPDGIDDHTASTLPLNALTARQAVDLATVAPGQTVLVTGASGGVGGFAAQFAVAAGARVIAQASTGDEDYVAGLGVDTVLGRLTPAELVQRVHALVPGGADVVLDAVPLGPALIGAVRDGGSFVTVLDQALPAPERGIAPRKVSVVPNAGQLTDIAKAAATDGLVTRVADVTPLAEAAQAHRRAEAGGVRGRLVLSVG